MTKEQVIELLEKERAWMLSEIAGCKAEFSFESEYERGFVMGEKQTYDECQNSLIHVIEEIKKL